MVKTLEEIKEEINTLVDREKSGHAEVDKLKQGIDKKQKSLTNSDVSLSKQYQISKEIAEDEEMLKFIQDKTEVQGITLDELLSVRKELQTLMQVEIAEHHQKAIDALNEFIKWSGVYQQALNNKNNEYCALYETMREHIVPTKDFWQTRFNELIVAGDMSLLKLAGRAKLIKK